MKLKIYLLAGILLSGFSQLYAQSGQFGDHVYWSLEDSVLTVSGEGDMYNNALTYLREIYFISGDHWYDCRYGIKMENNSVSIRIIRFIRVLITLKLKLKLKLKKK